MAFGSRIRSGDGAYIQIDGTYENLALSAKGTATSSVWNSSFTPNRGIVSIQITGTSPVIAVSSSTKIALLRRTKSGSTFTFTLWTETPGVTFTYYIWDVVGSATQAFAIQWGKRVRNESTGAVVFDSRYKYMRVIGAITGQPAAGADVTLATQSSGVAVLLAYAGSELIAAGGAVGGGNTWTVTVSLYVAAVSFSGGTVTASRVAADANTVSGSGSSGIPSTGNWGSTAVRHLILDVTNY